jgi:hypothetical protein
MVFVAFCVLVFVDSERRREDEDLSFFCVGLLEARGAQTEVCVARPSLGRGRIFCPSVCLSIGITKFAHQISNIPTIDDDTLKYALDSRLR